VGNYSYDWSPSTDLSSSSIDTPLPYPDSNLTYRLIVSNSNNCVDTAFVQLQVNHPDPGLANDTARCGTNDTLTIVADSGFAQYQWSNSDSTRSSTVGGDGTYWVAVQDSIDCWGERFDHRRYGHNYGGRPPSRSRSLRVHR